MKNCRRVERLSSDLSRAVQILNLILLGLLFCLQTAQAGTTNTVWPVKGLVFVDVNGNGICDAGEKGFADAVLSDGMAVIRADAQGRFAFDAVIDPMLQEGELPIVTLSTPDGHRMTTPWFRRIKGEAAHDENLLFGVQSEKQMRPLEIVQITDTHWVLNTPANEMFYEQFSKDMQAGADRFRFLLHTGDGFSCDHYPPDFGLTAETALRDMMNRLPFPWRMVPGNHEAISGWQVASWQKSNPHYGYGLYWDLFGPVRWSFTYAGIHFVGVDMMERQPNDTWRYGAPSTTLAWLERDLATIPTDMPVYVFGHAFGDKWRPLFRKISHLKGVFMGDSHKDLQEIVDGVPWIQSGSLCLTAPVEFRGYRIIRIDEEANFTEGFRFPGQEAAICIFPRRVKVVTDPEPMLYLRDSYAYGLDLSKDALTVTVDGHPAKVSLEKPERFRTRFRAEVPLSQLPNGWLTIVATAKKDGKEVRSPEHVALNTHGRDTSLPGKADARLHLAVAGVDVPAEVWINGRKLATISKTNFTGDQFKYQDKAQRFDYDVPHEWLTRLNLVELRPGLKDGQPDVCFLTYCWMEYEGQSFYDINPACGFGSGTPWVRPHYIDLTVPMSEDSRNYYTRYYEAQTEP